MKFIYKKNIIYKNITTLLLMDCINYNKIFLSHFKLSTIWPGFLKIMPNISLNQVDKRQCADNFTHL